ncbi:MAG: DUF368 domain-containing protein [Clostridia bacterium]|nr:DUF368 domain-containing protein [Clostridia bacterium]
MSETIRHYARRFLAGVMLGVGGMLPGVSGSVLAVAFGLYGPILDALATFFKNVKENIKLLLPVGLGGVAGLYAVAVILNRVLDKYEVPLIFLFCGLIAGSMPALIREAKAASGGLKKRHFIAAAAGLALSLLLLLIEREPGVSEAAAVGPFQSAVTGALLTAGSILPGCSMSFVLFKLGWYAPMMAAFTSMNVRLLLWAVLGALIAAVSLIGLMRMLIKKYPGPTYCLVIGLMIGSMISSLPHVPLAWGSLVYAIPFAVGALAAWLMAKFGE